MTEGPIGNLIILLSKSNKSQVTFVTIKDNTQKSKWCTIGKVNDWIRKYSDNYYIVRGMEGGIHFHLVALLHKHAVLKVTAKGVHFHIQTLNKTNAMSIVPIYDEQMHYIDHIHREKLRRERIIINNRIPSVLIEISAAIIKYWKSKNSQSDRLQAKLTKCKHIDNIMQYLEKNLLENPNMVIREYNTHILKYTGIAK